MRINWRKGRELNIWIVLVFLSGVIMSCEEYQEGCMDATATNFKVSNQVPCCCEYPDVVFQTTLTNGDNALPFSDTFTNQMGQQYLVRDLRFLVSHITLTDSLDKIYQPVDTFHNYLISPGVLAVDVLNLNSKGANFMADGTFNRLSFSLDQIEDLEGKEPDDFPPDHPLRDSSFYNFTQRSWVYVKAVIEVIDKDVIVIDLPVSELPIPISVRGNWIKNKGSDLTVNLGINISELFSGMDFSLPVNELIREFATNLPASFEL